MPVAAIAAAALFAATTGFWLEDPLGWLQLGLLFFYGMFLTVSTEFLYLLRWVSVPLLVLFLFYRYAENRSPMRLAVANFVLTYVAIVLENHLFTIWLDYRLASFDLDGDGVFSGPEITPEQEEALLRVVNGTGRAFAPFTGFAISLWHSTFFFVALKAFKLTQRYFQGLKD